MNDAGRTRRLLPGGFQPLCPLYRFFVRLRIVGVFAAINDQLLAVDGERFGLEVSATAAVIDSQSVKTVESGDPGGCDAGGKLIRRKRQAMLDTGGRSLTIRSASKTATTRRR